MAALAKFMTAEQFDALSEDERRDWELLDGELIEVSSATPKHSRIRLRLCSLLDAYAEANRLGVVLPETDLAVRKDTRLRPDFGFFSAAKWRNVDIDRVPVLETPDIAVEIISPSETGTTIQRKTEAYLKWGVHEIWLIYPDTQTVMTHTLAGAQRLSEGAFLTSEYVPGWRLQLTELFGNL